MRKVVLSLFLFNMLFGYTPPILVGKKMKQYAKFYIDIGRSYADEGRYDTAIWFYKKALRITPRSDTAYCNMGLAYYHIDEFSKALNLCKKAIYSNPKNIELYKYTGALYNDMQRYYKAFKAYSKALEIDPDDMESLLYIGDFYGVVKRDYNRSIEMYERAISAHPERFKPYFHTAYLYIDLKDYSKAIDFLKKSIELEPSNPEVYHSLFELELVENREFDSQIEQNYILRFKKNRESFAIYEMLKIMRDIYIGKNGIDVDDWANKYKDVYIPDSWQFGLLESWIEKIPKGVKRVKLMRALYIFKEHRRDTL